MSNTVEIVETVLELIKNSSILDKNKETYTETIKKIVTNLQFDKENKKKLDKIANNYNFEVQSGLELPSLGKDATNNQKLVYELKNFKNELTQHIDKLCILNELLF